MTPPGLIASKRRLRAMAGAGMLFMPLASQASDLSWTARGGEPASASVLRGQISDRTPLASAVHASLSGAQTPPPFFSLQNSTISEKETPSAQATINLPVPPSASIIHPKPGRDAQDAAQVAAYVTAPAALFSYGNQMQGGLHQRLGEIRNIMPVNDIGGEVFVRYSGTQFNVESGTGLSKDGYDFKQQVNAVQLGGSVIGWNDEGANLRAGWAYDQGSVRVTPKKSGSGYTDYEAQGMSLWVTAQRDSGLYLDVVASHRRYEGRVHDSGDTGSANVRAGGWAVSVETGAPTPLTDSVTVEPQAQVTYQSLRIHPMESAGRMVMRGWSTRQTTARIGVRIAKTDNERFVPYAKLDFSKHFGGQAKAVTHDAAHGSGETLDGVRQGTSVGLSAGMTIKVSRMVDFYGDVGGQRRLGDRGANGLAVNAGVRVSF